jgi:probable HAF family extracellular repeat protein
MHRSLTSCFFLLLLLGGEAVADNRSLGIVLPEGAESVAYDMNAAGQVAAVIEDDQGQRGIFFEHGKSIDVGSLGGLATEAKHINDKGEIIGSASRKDGNWSAYLYDRTNGMQVLGTLGGASSHGAAINDAGAAVGFADVASGDWHAFLYQRGEPLKDLGTLGGKISYASGINNRGQVVGTATLPNGYRHAFLYEVGRGMVDLGTLGGRISTATAINDNGVVVGASEMPNRRWHAFVYDGHRMTDLGALTGGGDSFASGINNAGHVVGTVLYEDARMSFVWRDNKMMLHGPGKGLYLTNAINNAELVIGATNDHGLSAAAMPSSTPPFVDPGLNKFLKLIAAMLVLAGAAVASRKRYRGILFGAYGD